MLMLIFSISDSTVIVKSLIKMKVDLMEGLEIQNYQQNQDLTWGRPRPTRSRRRA